MVKLYQCCNCALGKKGLLFFFLLLFSIVVSGKDVVNIATYDRQTVTVPASGVFFVDSGGTYGEYQRGENYILRFYSGADNIPLKLNFTSFDVEAHSSCRYDYLAIYDGSTTNATLIGKYCGTSLPGEITSTGAYLTIVFHSDGGLEFAGWVADVALGGDDDGIPNTNPHWFITTNTNDNDNDGIPNVDEQNCTSTTVGAGRLKLVESNGTTNSSTYYTLDDGTDWLIFDIGHIASAGTKLRLSAWGEGDNALVAESLDKTTWSADTELRFSRADRSWIAIEYFLKKTTRYLRIKKAQTSNSELFFYGEDNQTYESFNSQECEDIDTDEDGIPNHLDQDSDNDGILDIDECGANTAANGTVVFDKYNPPNPSKTFTNVDGSGLNATVSFSNSTNAVPATFLASDVFTLYTNGGLGDRVTETITFDFSNNPLDEVRFSIIHINENGNGGGDEIEFYATTESGAVLTNPTLSAPDSPTYALLNGTATGSTTPNMAKGTVAGDPGSNGNLGVQFNADSSSDRIVAITLLWRDLDNITNTHGIGFKDIEMIRNANCLDTDGDGAPDYLDLDSDNDGCPDALEGGAFVIADLLVGGTLGGGVNATTGIPNKAGAGQAVGTSKDATQQADECNPCNENSSLFNDTDGDGVGDACDLDDDNDGILDLNEECMGFVAQNATGAWKGNTASNATFTWAPIADSRGDNTSTIKTSQSKFHINDGVGGAEQWVRYKGKACTVTVDFDAPVPASEIGFLILDVNRPSVAINPTWTIFINGVKDTGGIFRKEEIITTDKDDNVVIADGVVSFSAVNILSKQQRTVLVGRDNTMVSSLRIEAKDILNGDWIGYSVYAYKSCDTDGDGLADRVDLDSDHDGCLDAIEGAGNFTDANLVDAGGTVTVGNDSGAANKNLCAGSNCVRANGVPTVVKEKGQKIGSSQDANQQAEECDPCNPKSALFTDSDGDGVGDACDLDDDNDGILDTDECGNIFIKPATVVSADFTPVSGTVQQLLDGEGKTGNKNDGTGPYPHFYWYHNQNPVVFKIKMNASSEINQVKFYDSWGVKEDVKEVKFTFFNGTTNLGEETLTLPLGYENGYVVNLSKTYVGVTDVDFEVVEDWQSSEVTPKRVSLIEIVFRYKTPCPDTDGDGIPDYLDLDSDNDGCPDAIEGGASFIFGNLKDAKGTVTVGNGSTAENKNLGNSVNKDGIPEVIVAGQAIGSSQDATTQAEVCLDDPCDADSPLFKDSDEDGIADACDPDDDNDNILDIDEQDCLTKTAHKGSLVLFKENADEHVSGYWTLNNNTNWIIFDLGHIAPAGTIITFEGAGGYDDAAVSESKDGTRYGAASVVDFTSVNGWNQIAYPLRKETRYLRIKKAQLTPAPLYISAAESQMHERFEYQECDEVDTDSDGIPNHLDLDSDNDGILDEEEGNCGHTAFFLEDFGTGGRTSLPSGTTNYEYQSVPYDGVNDSNVMDGQYAIVPKVDNSLAYWVSCYWVDGAKDHTPGDINGRMALFNADYEPGEFYRRTAITVPANTVVELGFWVMNIDLADNCDHLNDRIYPRIKAEVRNAGGDLIAEMGTGDIPKNETWNKYKVRFNTKNNTSITFILINAGVGGGGNDLVIDDITVTESCDTDGDGILDRLDLDTDADGCPDAIEGGENATPDNLVEDTGIDGGSTNIQVNLGNTVGNTATDRGVPTIVNNGGAADVGGDVGQGEAKSVKAGKITVNQPPYNQTVCLGNGATFTATATALTTSDYNGGLPDYTDGIQEDVIYQWQKYNTGTSNWEDIAGENGTVASGEIISLGLGIQNDTSNDGAKYRVKLTSPSLECPEYSAEATLNLGESPNCEITGEDTLCPRSTATYSAPDGMNSYAWSVAGATIVGATDQKEVTIKAGAVDEHFILTLTVANANCTATCTKLVNVIDNELPDFKVPDNIAFCVNDITDASYRRIVVAGKEEDDIHPDRPDYYKFEDGYTGLDLTEISDNCCPNNEIEISWEIQPASKDGVISGVGQPSKSIGGKELWLDMPANLPKASYTPKNYMISYRVEDCNGNVHDVINATIITIKPRPRITKVN